MTTKKYRAAGGVVVQQGVIPGLDPERRYILLLDRPSRNEVRLPKGHVDPGESVEEAALRETVEEAGYADLEVIADLGEQVVAYDYQGNHYIRQERYFLMRLRSQVQLPRNEIDTQQFNVCWTPGEHAVAALTYEAEQQWVQRAMRLLPTLV